MSDYTPSAALLNSSLMRRQFDARQIDAIMSGQFETKRATRQPNWAGRRHPDGHGPYGERARQKRVYDRTKSRHRKRMRGGDGRIPYWLRQWFTEGERAALSVIAAEVMKNGACDLPIEKIASIAGISVRTVQYAIATAAWRSSAIMKLPECDRPPLLLHVEYRPRKGAKSLSNRIKIISREWVNWLSYTPSEAPALEAVAEGEWRIMDMFAGRMPPSLLTGCKKKHTSKTDIQLPSIYDKPVDLEDGWQRLRAGLPLKKGAYEKEEGANVELPNRRQWG
ncbi:hypothetical protein LJR030_003675 [Rhizobium sp. LjRoot30]|uniref:hypothetical protein n=1 Tax=Rhizobium sp. LjRoot30 TaxID=3342320 RepID=UPI003ED082E9